MLNTDGPPGYEPPTSAQLLRSTLIALAVAAVVLVAFVLPSEYGLDPTGVGTALGLTRMGEIKTQLAGEAEADAVAHDPDAAPAEVATKLAAEDVATEDVAVEKVETASVTAEELTAPVATNGHDWRDETVVVLAPDEAAELKLAMKAGEQAHYEWAAVGGTVNFNTHGHGGGEAITYDKGRDAQDGKGTLEAPFDGHHGWFFRNRSAEPVSLTLRTRGEYAELTRTR